MDLLCDGLAFHPLPHTRCSQDRKRDTKDEWMNEWWMMVCGFQIWNCSWLALCSTKALVTKALLVLVTKALLAGVTSIHWVFILVDKQKSCKYKNHFSSSLHYWRLGLNLLSLFFKKIIIIKVHMETITDIWLNH